MTGTYQYANPYIYESQNARCWGGPLDGQSIPVRGIYVQGPFKGRYQLEGFNEPLGRLADIEYAYTYDPIWTPEA
jgi:hypothetical protein